MRSIANSTPEYDYEVTIVDDSPTRTAIDEENERTLKQRLGLIRAPKRSFISKAKNLGWRRARGEYVFFIDDDNVLPKGTLETLASKLDRDHHIAAVMPVVFYEKRRQLAWVYAAPFEKGRWSFDLVGRNTQAANRHWPELLATDALPNAFMVRRQLLEELGGFDESLPINSSCDFCQRMKKTGHQVFALTTAAIYHDVTPPNVLGYWAEHAAVDSERRYFEVRDWFNLMARLHHDESLLPLRELLHAIPFLTEVGIGILLHPSRPQKRILPVYGAMLQGVSDGIKIAAAPSWGLRGSY